MWNLLSGDAAGDQRRGRGVRCAASLRKLSRRRSSAAISSCGWRRNPRGFAKITLKTIGNWNLYVFAPNLLNLLVSSIFVACARNAWPFQSFGWSTQPFLALKKRPLRSFCLILFNLPPLTLCSCGSQFCQPHLCQRKQTGVRELSGSVASRNNSVLQSLLSRHALTLMFAQPTHLLNVRPGLGTRRSLCGIVWQQRCTECQCRRQRRGGVGHFQVALHLLDLQCSWPTHAMEALVPSSVWCVCVCHRLNPKPQLLVCSSSLTWKVCS